MLLAFDIGNSNITLGVFDADILICTARIATDKKKTSDQYAVDIKNILDLHGVNCEEAEDCIICSVVPQTGSAVAAAVAQLFEIVPLEVGPGIKTGLNIKIDNPAQLGADLVAGAVGAIAEYTLPCIVIDMGTATTVSVIDKEGRFLGGAIAAGVNLTLKALCENTAQLPSVSLTAPSCPIGSNTADCMRSGIIFGTASMLDGMIDRISDELEERPTVVATGGLSKLIINYCKNDIIFNENLLLEGLKDIYEKNKQ